MKRKLLISFSLCLGLVACSETTEETEASFDRSQLLDNIGSGIIVPEFADFSTRTSTLSQQAAAFVETPSLATLDQLQEAWESAARQWELVAMFDLGPMDDQDLMTSISNFPTNTIAIEDAISAGEQIDESYITNQGSTSKGLPAIEYLLFDQVGGDEAILDSLTNEKRQAYLMALCENLASIAEDLDLAWSPDAGNYLSTFVSTDGKDAGSSIVMLANELIILTESVKNNKVGVPLGKKSMGTLLPNEVEAWRSGSSIALIEQNVDAIERVYKGMLGDANGVGFDDYLDEVNAQYEGVPLSGAISDQLVSIREALGAIQSPLQEALTSQNAEVENLYNELQKLVVLFKTDMMSSLGLLVTFSDNDGD